MFIRKGTCRRTGQGDIISRNHSAQHGGGGKRGWRVAIIFLAGCGKTDYGQSLSRDGGRKTSLLGESIVAHIIPTDR